MVDRRWLVVGLLAALPLGCSAGAGTPPPDRPAAPPAAAAAAPTPPALQPLRLSTSTASGTGLIPWAPYDAGLFEEYGLAVDGVPDIASSTTAVQTLLAGDVEMIHIAPNPAIEAHLKGAPLMVQLANTPPGTGFRVFAVPDIQSIDELHGKTVGANQVGSSSYFLLTYALRTHGLQVDRDYRVVSVGNSLAQVAALQQGQVQAGVLPSPANILARQAGLTELQNLHDVPYNGYGPVVRRELLDEPAGREVLRRYLQASLAGIARLRGDREFAYAVIRKWLKVEDAESLAEIYATYLPRRLPTVQPEALPLVMESIAERDPSARTANPDLYYDNSLLAELDRAGFVDSLYR